MSGPEETSCDLEAPKQLSISTGTKFQPQKCAVDIYTQMSIAKLNQSKHVQLKSLVLKILKESSDLALMSEASNGYPFQSA